MTKKRRQFQRKIGQRRYRKLFIIATEGKKTEPQYFALLNNQQSIVLVECLRPSGGSSPLQVLERMKNRLEREKLRKSDEAWLVVDKDEWTDEQLTRLHGWSQEQENYGLVVSNPKFEYWIVLHFEDGAGISNPHECSDRLRKYLPYYDKGIDRSKVTPDMIIEAVRRARQRDNPCCVDWPRAAGTTMYRLVEKILGDKV